MTERSFDEMIAYFNRRVADMDISQDYKMELLGMVTALGYKHEKSAQQWIPCKVRPPEESGTYIVTAYDGTNKRVSFVKYQKTLKRWDLTGARSYWRILAYKPLPEPFEPQINEAAFDALEMAIQAIQKYSTWSQTYSNMVEDMISRKAALDAIHRYFGKRIEQSPMHKTVDGEVYDLGICNPLLEDNKALSQAIKELPSAQPERKKDIIQTFHDYQIEWLTNHYDLALEPQLGELVVRFLHDTANMYMLEMERRTDETD